MITQNAALVATLAAMIVFFRFKKWL